MKFFYSKKMPLHLQWSILFVFLFCLCQSLLAQGIYFSMTTSPERIHQIPQVLESLKSEISRENFKSVYINIPMKYRNSIEYDPESILLLEQELEKVPEFKGKVVINRVPRDLGPITKILPTAELLKKDESTRNSIIVSIDDDQIYKAAAIRSIIEKKVAKPELVVTGGGGVMTHWKTVDHSDSKKIAKDNEERLRLIRRALYLRKGINIDKQNTPFDLKMLEKRAQEIGFLDFADVTGEIWEKHGVAFLELTNDFDPVKKRKEKRKRDDEIRELMDEAIRPELNQFLRRRAKEIYRPASGLLAFPDGVQTNLLTKPTEEYAVDVIEGYSGVAYSPSDLDTELLGLLSDERITNRECKLSDDLVIGFVLGLYNKSKVNTSTARANKPSEIEESGKKGGLQTGDGLVKKKGESPSEDEAIPEEMDKVAKAIASRNFGETPRVEDIKYNYCLMKLVELTYDHELNRFKSVETIKSELRSKAIKDLKRSVAKLKEEVNVCRIQIELLSKEVHSLLESVLALRKKVQEDLL